MQNSLKTSKIKQHDCIVAFSGGVESTALLHHVVKRGQTPLVIHVDVVSHWHHQVEAVDIISSKLDVDTRYIEFHNEHPLSDKQKMLSHYWDLGINPPFFFTWSNIMQIVNINNPHIHNIYYGFNTGIDKHTDWVDDHFRSIERVLGALNIPTQFSAPLGHMTKREQWDTIPRDLKHHVHSCSHRSKKQCGVCIKCLELNEII